MKYPENSNWVNQRPDRLQHFDAARLIQRDLKQRAQGTAGYTSAYGSCGM